MFLSGSKSLLTITNPSADTDRELVIFRDSFASSLAPLLTERLCEDHAGRYPLCAAGAAWPLADVRFTGCPVPLQRLCSQSQRNPQIKNARRPVHGRRAFCVRSCKNSCIKCVMSTISVRYVVKVLRFSPLKDTGKKTCICRNMWEISRVDKSVDSVNNFLRLLLSKKLW